MGNSFSTTSASGSASGTYIDQADIEAQFGASNVQVWSQLQNDQETVDTSRIQEAINNAEAMVEDRFRGSRYKVPFGGTLTTVKRWMAQLAGVDLYMARGWDDEGQEGEVATRMENLRVSVTRQMDQVLMGSVDLPLNKSIDGPTSPVVVR